jgi:patatin-like phospholipase/acyl hydrolase
MRVDQIREFYIDSGKKMFSRAGLLNRVFKYKFEDKELAKQLKSVFGNATLGSSNLKTLLMMVMRNATTDSPWPISNNPKAYYNNISRTDCNLNFPLWQLIRASTAAPTFFPPEEIDVNQGKPFVFVDGGITSFNNPAFQLFLMATTEPYNLNWNTGEDKMLLVSIGTGMTPNANKELKPGEMNLIYNAKSIPSALMYASQVQQDFLCRVFGKCLAGDSIEREIGSMIGKKSPDNTKLFTYVRYNAELSRDGLDHLSLTDIDEKDVQPMDSVKHIGKLQRVGQAIAKIKVKESHFDGFLN